MSGRRANLALSLLVAAAVLTGVAAFGTGTPSGAWILVAHGVVGLAIILLAPRKSAVARRGLARRRRGWVLSIGLTVAVAAAVLTGILFSSGWVLSYGPVTAMQVHVAAAAVALILVLVHIVMRPVRPRRADLNRRNVLRIGALAGFAGALWLGLEGTSRALGWPGARRRFTGSHENGSFVPGAMPVTQWLDDQVPPLSADAWELRLRDLDGPGRVLTYEQFLRFDDELVAVLDCTGGWYATQRWAGARLDRLLDVAGGRSIVVGSVTGYRRRFPIAGASTLVLAHTVGGVRLSAGHGFPARIVAPGRRGFWWVKWVEEITVEDRPAWLQSPFPLT
jgi:hypothetical protein